jgi:hypothetical protein
MHFLIYSMRPTFQAHLILLDHNNNVWEVARYTQCNKLSDKHPCCNQLKMVSTRCLKLLHVAARRIALKSQAHFPLLLAGGFVSFRKRVKYQYNSLLWLLYVRRVNFHISKSLSFIRVTMF